MDAYSAPLRDMRFVLEELAPLDEIARLPGQQEFNADLAMAVLEEADKFASGVLAPLNRPGDLQGARLEDGKVHTVPGWQDAYRRFVEGGWNGLACNPEYGGQGLPRLLSAMVEEMWNAANMSFTLGPMLTLSAIEAIEARGSDELKARWLPHLASGEWTGTMNLTEPQAGSDLAAVRTRAEPQGDGTYRLRGQKIFITYGDHDLTPNIVHLVLARTPDAPEGVKGISLFVVPKMLPGAEGEPLRPNDVRCVSLEHKLGIHASPTCVLAYGDHEGALGWRVGEEGRGLEIMFIVMNAARFGVGIEGLGISERAYQRARAYARERVQGAEVGQPPTARVPIIKHPDVRRMLMAMKSRVEAMRSLVAVVASSLDLARVPGDAAQQQAHQGFVDLMIPVVKGWCTENAVLVTSLGLQVHGGMGYIEETGAAQHFRDARITPIYEGTTGIQANDLVGRKIARDGGRAVAVWAARMREEAASLGNASDERLRVIAAALQAGITAVEQVAGYIATHFQSAPKDVLAGAVPTLELFGIVAGGWQMARAAQIASQRIAEGSADAFYQAKIETAAFYASHVLGGAPALAATVTKGARQVLGMDEEQF